MKIDYRGAELVRGARPARTPASGGEPVRPAAAVERADRVQVSQACGEVAARGGEGPELALERIAEVRRRILEGAYGSAEVVGQVARGILARGDL